MYETFASLCVRNFHTDFRFNLDVFGTISSVSYSERKETV